MLSLVGVPSLTGVASLGVPFEMGLPSLAGGFQEEGSIKGCHEGIPPSLNKRDGTDLTVIHSCLLIG